MKLKSKILKGMMSRLTLQDLLLKINYLKQIKIFADPWFNSEKLGFNDTNIDELLDIQYN